MFLKKLYANGFKSIGKKVEIDLMNDVNVIMGPNGSGKSNFFECIQWVLGGMSAKQLRANSMEDVLFDGGEGGKPADVAEATLVFDNTDRELEFDMDEVSITRKLTRGKGTEYFINNQPAKLRELTNLFLNKGIGKNNYAITGQNRITEFILMKPDDIRGVIEEAAGISGFRLKKNELVNSIANYDRDIERIDAVISEISRSLKPLKKQIKNAEIYESIKVELDEKKLFYYSEMLNKLSKDSDEKTTKLNELTLLVNNLSEEKLSIEDFLNEYTNNASTKGEQLASLENIKNEIEELLSDLSKDKIMNENTLTNLKEKHGSMLANIKNLEESSTIEEEEKKNLFNAISNLSKEISDLEENISKNDSNIESLKTDISNINSFLESAKEQITNFTVEKEKKDKDLEIYTERINTLTNSINSKQYDIDITTEDLDKFKCTFDANLSRISDIEDRLIKLKSTESQIKSIEHVINASKKNDSKKKRTNDVKELFKNVQGFYDVLFNIVSYDKKYDNAMDTLYGSILHNFVVEDVKAAESCVSILKKNKIPPANFIIMSKLKGQSKAPDIDDVCKVSSILKYDNKYNSLINDYFSNSFIADDSPIAEKAWNETSQKYRICTLDGTLYASNVLRGGYIQKDSKKLESDYKKLLSEKESLLTLDSEVFTNHYELKGKINVINKENESLKKQINAFESRLNNLLSEKEKIEKNLVSIKEKFDLVSKEILDINSSKSQLTDDISVKNVSLEDANSKIIELSSLRENLLIDVNKKKTLLAENEKQYYIYKNNSQEQIESLKSDIDIVNEQILLAEDKLNKSTHDYDLKKADLDEATSKWSCLRDEIEKDRAEKDNKSNRLNFLITEISSCDNNITKLNFELEKLSEKIKVCEEESLEIPEETEFKMFDGNLQDIRSDIEKLEKKIKSLGFINTDAISEYKELNERYEVMTSNKNDLEESKGKILVILQQIQDDMTYKYMNCYNQLKSDFSSIFTKLFNGGSAELIMENPNTPLESGVIIKATPPGKKNKAISLLSGGEKSLAAVSFIFTLLKYNPSPVVIFDEIDAALDEINVSLIADYIRENANAQYVIVSHRVPMMKVAKALYGASMNKGVTELISQKL